MHQNVAELHALLARARVKPQYVLVGHSLGGLMARVYAAEYPEQVAGMVLIEATHEDNQIMLNGKMMPLRSLSRARSVPPPRLRIVPSDSEGSGSTTLPPVPAHVEAPYDRLPPEIQELHLWALSQPKLVAAASEFDYLPEEVDQIHAERLHHAVPLESKPLIVLTRNGASGDHASQQIDLLKLSRNSRQIIAATNDHHIQLTDPEAVVTAIHDVVESVRHHSLLGPRN
jgi:pimeloyl-ACP methyl ester carboxylesterase